MQRALHCCSALEGVGSFDTLRKYRTDNSDLSWMTFLAGFHPVVGTEARLAAH